MHKIANATTQVANTRDGPPKQRSIVLQTTCDMLRDVLTCYRNDATRKFNGRRYPIIQQRSLSAAISFYC